ncbi:MAG: hypothetical protein ACI9B8_002220, partial [Sulfitobacter sp.]
DCEPIKITKSRITIFDRSSENVVYFPFSLVRFTFYKLN